MRRDLMNCLTKLEDAVFYLEAAAKNQEAKEQLNKFVVDSARRHVDFAKQVLNNFIQMQEVKSA